MQYNVGERYNDVQACDATIFQLICKTFKPLTVLAHCAKSVNVHIKTTVTEICPLTQAALMIVSK